MVSKELMREKIAKAQAAIEKSRGQVGNAPMRNRYHFMGEAGWINDPNGLVHFKGKYHFFYQHNPYSAFWGSMHWGHAVSDDLVHWEYLPIALAPSEDYDDCEEGGCFSGSAIEHDGKLFLFYTSTMVRDGVSVQTQSVAWSWDGVEFEKYALNPVILPHEGVDSDQFRDPKVWKHGDSFYLICGARKEGRGLAIVYKSDNLLDWTLLNEINLGRGEWGSMWECPDFFPLGGRHVLTFSPISPTWHTAVWFVGDFDYERGVFTPITYGDVDYGFDCYAPQSFLAPDGRRLCVCWANGWQWMPLWKDWGPTYKEGWCGSFNLTREVRLENDNKLQFVPVRELGLLRQDATRLGPFEIGEAPVPLKAGDGVAFEMKFAIDLKNSDCREVVLELRAGGGLSTICVFDLKASVLTVDRSGGDGWSRGRSAAPLDLRGRRTLDVHVFSDQSILEVFSCSYRSNIADNIFAPDGADGIAISAREGTAAITSYEAYGMGNVFRGDK